MSQYKAIFLDWDDTIGDFRGAERKALQDIYTKYELQNIYPAFDDYFNNYHPYNIHLWELYGKSQITKDELQLARFLHPLLDKVTSDTHGLPPLRAIAEQMGDDFLTLTNRYFALLPDAEHVVKELAHRYPLTIVSNGFIEVQYTKIRLSGLTDCFKHIVLSEEVGCQKPNPKIFEKALSLNSLRADEALMIGDSYSSDIVGAQNAHIDQLWICPTQPTETQQATYRVSSLREVLNII